MTNSKLIFDLIENGDENITKSYITSMICEKAKARLDEEKEKESGSTESAEIKADSEKDEITLDPEFQKEFFLKTFEYKGKIITLKKVGMGASAPVSAYVDGKRKDIFLSLKQARKGIKNIIDIEDRVKTPEPKGEEIEGQPPTIESLKNSDEYGIAIVHEDWTVSFLSHDEVSDLLEIHSRLNKKNKDNFEDKLSKSQESASDMLHYFQERIKRDLL
jgi:transcriptional regulator